MILCDSEIRAALKNEQLVINPAPALDHISPTAVDLTLGNEFKRWELPDGKSVQITIDPSQPGFFKEARAFLKDIPPLADGGVVIRPGEFILGITHERIELPITSRLAARVEGRSSLARLGLGVHVTAPTIHAGWHGQVALELTNQANVPILLRPGLKVCQLIFEMVFGTPSRELTGIFQDQTSVLGQAG